MININILKTIFKYLTTGELISDKNKSIKYIYDNKNNLIGYYVFDISDLLKYENTRVKGE